MPSFLAILSATRASSSMPPPTQSHPSSSSTSLRLPKSRSSILFSKAPKTPLQTHVTLASRPALTPPSSSSSDGSTLPTPDDDMHIQRQDKKRWPIWLPWRRSSAPAPSLDDAPNAAPSNKSPPPAHRPSATHAPQALPSDSDDDNDTSPDAIQSSHQPASVLSHSRSTLSMAQLNLQTMLCNQLVPSFATPPLVDAPSTQFPRSMRGCGLPQTMPSRSLEPALHARRLLRRLQDKTFQQSELAAIASLGSLPQPKVALKNGLGNARVELMARAPVHVAKYSRGLRKWALRPCFEQRCLVWRLNDEGTLIYSNVNAARGLAVCELEFSAALEILAGLELDGQTFENEVHVSQLPVARDHSLRGSYASIRAAPMSTHSLQGSVPKADRPRIVTSLSIERGMLPKPNLSPVTPLSTTTSDALPSPILRVETDEPAPELAASTPPPRRSVRFEDNMKNDIALAYALQARKKRQERERLREAARATRGPIMQSADSQKPIVNKRTSTSDARLRQETERRSVYETEASLEEVRKRSENEKRIVEEMRAREERNQARYTEEIAAARQRRELARSGLDSIASVREAKQRERDPVYSRPAYDRRACENSSSGVGTEDIEDKRSVRTALSNRPVNTREESLPRTVRPHSTYRENVQQQSHSIPERLAPSQMPGANGSPVPIPVVPCVMMPIYATSTQMPMLSQPSIIPQWSAWPMPLIPPSAPFMRNQLPASSSRNSPRSSDSSSSQRQSMSQQALSGSMSPPQIHPQFQRHSSVDSATILKAAKTAQKTPHQHSRHHHVRSASYSAQMPSSSSKSTVRN